MKTYGKVLVAVLAGLVVVTTSLAIQYNKTAVKAEAERLAGVIEMEKLKAALEVAEMTRQRLEATASMPARPVDAPISGVTVPEDTALLQARVTELEFALRQRDDQINQMRDQANMPQERQRPPRQDWNQRMEEMKQNEPERYKQIVQQQEEARSRVQSAFARKAAFLLERDTSAMSEEEREEYQKMLDLLGETWSLAQKIAEPGLPREDRREIMRGIRDTSVQLAPMLQNEREKEFYALGLDFGYSSNQASEFVQYMNDVIDNTSMSSLWQGGRPRGGPDGGR